MDDLYSAVVCSQNILGLLEMTGSRVKGRKQNVWKEAKEEKMLTKY